MCYKPIQLVSGQILNYCNIINSKVQHWYCYSISQLCHWTLVCWAIYLLNTRRRLHGYRGYLHVASLIYFKDMCLSLWVHWVIDSRRKRFVKFREHVSCDRAICCAPRWLIQSNCQAKYVPSCYDITDSASLSIFFRFFVIADRRHFEKAICLYRDISMLSVSVFSLGFRALSREGIRCINFLK